MPKWANALLGVILVVGLTTLGLGISSVLTSPSAPPLDTEPVRQEVTAAPIPSTAPEEDVVIPVSATVRLEMPTIAFDSYDFTGQGVALDEWTQEEDDAQNGTVRPPDKMSIVQSTASESECYGQVGTDSTEPFCIYAHSWVTRAPFNHLWELKVGDPVAVTTLAGRICMTVSQSLPVPKGDFDDVLLAIKYQADGWAVTCDRDKDYPKDQATVDNRLVGFQIDQQATNAGTCW